MGEVLSVPNGEPIPVVVDPNSDLKLSRAGEEKKFFNEFRDHMISVQY